MPIHAPTAQRLVRRALASSGRKPSSAGNVRINGFEYITAFRLCGSAAPVRSVHRGKYGQASAAATASASAPDATSASVRRLGASTDMATSPAATKRKVGGW